MELILTPHSRPYTDNEKIRVAWGFHVLHEHAEPLTYYLACGQRGWVMGCSNGESYSIVDGDIVEMWGRKYECQLENPLI